MTKEEKIAFVRNPEKQVIMENVLRAILPLDDNGRVHMRDRDAAIKVTEILVNAIAEIEEIATLGGFHDR